MAGDRRPRTDGNPLFTEELAKSIAQSAGPDDVAAAAAIPGRSAISSTARLDALGDNKRMAQVAAVIGREIDVELLRTVTGMSRRQLGDRPVPARRRGGGRSDPGRGAAVHAPVRARARPRRRVRVAGAGTTARRAPPCRRIVDAASEHRPGLDRATLRRRPGRPTRRSSTTSSPRPARRPRPPTPRRSGISTAASSWSWPRPTGTARDMSELTVRVVRGTQPREHAGIQRTGRGRRLPAQSRAQRTRRHRRRRRVRDHRGLGLLPRPR